jgi:hypothetical protein
MQVGLWEGNRRANLAQKQHPVSARRGGSGIAGGGNLVVGVPSPLPETAPGTHGYSDTGNATGDDSGEWGGAPGTDD